MLTVHIFTKENLYNYQFINFLFKHFDVREHFFIYRAPHNKQYKYSPSFQTNNILYVDSKYKYIVKLIPLLLRARVIYIHFLPIGITPIIWLIFPSLIPKTSWILWGDDLYWVETRKKGFKANLYESIRRRVIAKLPRIIAFMEGDYRIAKSRYNTKAIYQNAVYPLPTDFEYLENIRYNNSIYKEITIQVGNSGDPSNDHIGVFEHLKRFSDHHFKIFCPLSYGGTKDYINSVIRYGKDAFGDRFFPLIDIIQPEEYSKLLLKINVAIFSSPRQQGLGNILALLFLGKKVYIRRETTPYEYFRKINVVGFPYSDLENISFKELIHFTPEIAENNHKIIKELFSEENYIRMWKEVLNINTIKRK
ncbi:MAG TPA: TDP-N-acetylfucosamine:lipid II N-acetylfucosaminyltransferase [Candidatus Marinimicrobia bacterium]|nr:TDP-N-acetylfucosamine:lipid II N-acetylfucosaminyltransferase [Candidatus Neomarinimicrobiota bacterium]HRS51073.1 TDP-N-acetylfucosamine:lipid II N-acetylfucosaminyltransferase [Candidatus Neomarinimicrobiota bacterium]HRU92579.1 TDP-N-acetylfucosamine:lipid II N-acetylfucosaminyltransferase [Candidatus Neomarinimicrobiota bacterium]